MLDLSTSFDSWLWCTSLYMSFRHSRESPQVLISLLVHMSTATRYQPLDSAYYRHQHIIWFWTLRTSRRLRFLEQRISAGINIIIDSHEHNHDVSTIRPSTLFDYVRPQHTIWFWTLGASRRLEALVTAENLSGCQDRHWSMWTRRRGVNHDGFANSICVIDAESNGFAENRTRSTRHCFKTKFNSHSIFK